MFDLWRRFFDERRFLRGRKLLRQAVIMADYYDYLGASKLLEEASVISPNDSEIWNELAYCCGKMGSTSAAERAAQKAIELGPANPKYRNSLIGIWLDECWKQTDRGGLECLLGKVAPELLAVSQLEEYPAAKLATALYQAFKGLPEEMWRSELQQAHALYLNCGQERTMADSMVVQQGTKCENAARMYQLLSRADHH